MGDIYVPRIVKIERIIRETPDTKTFYLPASIIKLSAASSLRREKHPLNFIPGQFLEISCLGIGEVPISIASSPHEEFLRISFKRVGYVTTGLFNIKEKDSLGIRGPFGNGFALNQLEGKNLIFIAGGIGIAPLRSLLKFVTSRSNVNTNNIILLYGSRSPKDLLYKKELNYWAKNIKVLITVDKPDAAWEGSVGVVSELLNKTHVEADNTIAFICGPDIMMRFTAARLIELGLSKANIVLSLERYMKCGVGKCGHCYISDKFVCKDGPVFTLEQLDSLVPVEILL